jgi:hypothetical protein
VAQTLVRKVMLQINSDDGDTEAKLDNITRKADELAAKHPELKVKIDSAAAQAKMGVLRQELKDVGKPVKVDVKVDDGAAMAKTLALDLELDRLKKKNSGSGPGLLSKILFGSGSGSGGGSGGGGLSGMLGKGVDSLGNIPVIGPLLGNPVLLAGVLSALMAVGSEVGALATGLTAAGLGVGSFALLAMPAFKSVSNAYTQIQADQLAYNRALTATAKSTALAHLKHDLDGLDPAQRQAVRGVQGLVGEFHNLSRAFEPTAFKVFNEGLGIANQLLPVIGQFATSAAPAIEGVLGMLSSGLKSDQFGGFIALLEQMSGPVITAVGSGLKGLAGDVMFLMERFSTKDAVNSVNIAFRVLGTVISLVTGLIMEGMIAWDFLTQKALPAASKAFDVTRHAVATAGHEIAHTFDDVRHDAAQWAGDVRHDFDIARHAVATLAHDTAAHFGEIRHDGAQWADDVRHDVDKVIAWFEALPGRLRHETAHFGDLLVSAGSSLVDGLVHGIEAKADALKHEVYHLGDNVKGWIKDAWGMASPSKVFARIGANIPFSLGLGITQSSASVLSKASTLAKSITNAVISGSITRSQAGQLGAALGAAMHAALRQSIGQALGPALQQELAVTGKSTKATLAALVQIWDAEKGGLISFSEASSLAKWVKADNLRLQTLARARSRIANEILAAKALASGTASATEGAYNLTSAAGSGSAPASAKNIISTLQGDVSKIRKFAVNIRKLAREGLNKSYLSQLIAMGPDGGGALAAELVAAGMGDIRQINAAERQITAASNQLGDASVSAIYTAGKKSGSAFVKTLEQQQKDINAVMAAAARHMVAELRKDLGASALGGASKVEIRLVGGDKAFRTWLKKMIRVTGGDVQVVGA